MTKPDEVTYTADEVAAHRATVVAALRSGEYLQTRGTLRQTLRPAPSAPADADPPVGYCCLGVVEQVRGCRWYDVREFEPRASASAYGNRRWRLDDQRHNATELGPDGRRWLGVERSDPYVAYRDPIGNWKVVTLTRLNDSWQLSLAEIGLVIEYQPADWDGTIEYATALVERRRREEASGDRD